MSNPLVSVVMSVFNGDPYIHNAIDSILNQTFTNFEFIIINDGSTDNSYNIIKEYAKIDSRIIYINQKNKGLTKSLNTGSKMAKGKYIARQDADDISLLNRFEKQLFWLEKKGYDFCCSRALLLKSNRIIPRYSYYFPDKFVSLFKNPYIHGTLIIRRDVIIEIGGYNERFIFSQDYKLVTELLKRTVRIKYLKEPLYILGEDNNRISYKYLEQQKIYFQRVRYMQWKNLIN